MVNDSVVIDQQESRSIRRGVLLLWLAFVALVASAGMDFIAAVSNHSPSEEYFSATVRLLGGVSIGFAISLVKKGKPKQAALTTIIAAQISLFVTGLFSPINLGWLLGLVISLLLSLIAIQLFPRSWMGIGIAISFIGSAVVALTDYINKSVVYQIDLSDPQYVLMIVLGVAMAFLVFFRFSSYPLAAKLVLAISSISAILFNLLSLVLASFIFARGDVPESTLLSMNMIQLFISQFSIILSAGTALWLAKFMIRPLYDISAVAETIAVQGDLSRQSHIYYKDEIGEMAVSFNHLIDSLNLVANNTTLIAKGDLTVNFTARSEDDVLGNSFEVMTEKLRHLVGQILNNSEQVSQASVNLAQAAELAGKASTQISQVMDQIAGGAIQQAEVATKTSASVENMQIAINGVEQGILLQSKAVNQSAELTDQIVQAIQQVISDAQAGQQKAGQAMTEADGGARTIQDTVVGMSKVQNKVEISAQKVLEMKKRSDEISNILEVIEEITSQINLLSLNAAIEAARAGEAGKGFAVVADEVRKLADKSTVATKEISTLIQSINHSTEEAVESMNASLEEVKNGTTLAGSAGQALSRITDTVKSMQEQVERIAASAVSVNSSTSGLISSMDQVSSIVESNTSATEEMANHAREVAKSVENIASISEENSASVEEVSSSVGEMSAQVVKVNDSAQMLTEMADNLEGQVKQFKI